MPALFRNFAIVYNSGKQEAFAVAGRLRAVLKKLGVQSKIYKSPPASFRGHDIAATIGGDGTLLCCVPAALSAQIPLVGVNTGNLGYLTSVDKNQLRESFLKILKGGFSAVPRMVLKATFPTGRAQYALNDLVIKSAEYRMAQLRLSVDGERVTEYGCDGLIFSTPTGSTAYNLSAGGPLLHFKTDAIVVTPICAHSLTNRSLVFNSRSKLKVGIGDSPCGIHINADGRTVCEGSDFLPLQIRQATRKLVTLEDPKRGSFETLREKLGWK